MNRKPRGGPECLENSGYCVWQCPGVRRRSVGDFVAAQAQHPTGCEATTANTT